MTPTPQHDSDTRIAAALARLDTAIGRRPDFGHVTHRSSTTLEPGLRCSTIEGEQVLAADLPPALGGEGSAPTPGCLLRAALGSCMAMGYRLRAARQGVELGAVRVDVETDSAIEGLLVGGPTPAGFTDVRVHVTVETCAPLDVVRRLIDDGDRLSPILDVVARHNTIHRSVAITPRSC